MYNLDTKEEVDFDYFMKVLRNNELQVVSKKWTEEEWKQLSKDIAICKAAHQKKPAEEPVLV
jgi:hypothetical protein